MKIRRATQKDISALTHLKKPQTDVHIQTFHENQLLRLKEMSKGKSIYLVIEIETVIVGHVLIKMSGIKSEPDYPNINDLYIAEKNRNQGLGTQLIRAAEKITEENGYSKISLSVNPTLNLRAKILYERLGYVQTDTPAYLDGIYDGDEDWVVDMIKIL